MSSKVRVRFAPSPTGALHIGGVRTALFNYLFAKKHGGDFILRIEDTDQKRYVKEAEEYIIKSLEWCGIKIDEGVGASGNFGPYRQSERKDMYKKYANQLIEEGKAYYAFDTSEELDELRTKFEQDGKNFIYNHTLRDQLNNSLNLSKTEIELRIQKEDYVIRFKTPTNQTLELNDIIRGEVKFDTNLLDDKILYKSDGMPTYHLANIVDDHLMEITHVIRGEEWLPSLPLHTLLYQAFGWNSPEFAHLPLILKPVGNGKLSKRDGDKLGFPVFPLQWKTEDGISLGYKEKGFYPEAVVNFLALLGWNDGTEKELFTMDELIESFDLTRVNKSGAKFDPEKNKWFNHQYLIQQNDADLAVSLSESLSDHAITNPSIDLEKVVSLIKERAHFPSELWELSDYFFVAPTSYDEKAKKNWKEETPELMTQVIEQLQFIDSFKSIEIETKLKDWMTQREIGMGKIMQPFRLSIVGAMKGPHLFDILEVIGKEETIKRLQKAIQTF